MSEVKEIHVIDPALKDGTSAKPVFTEAFVRSTTSAGRYQTDEAYCNSCYPNCALKSTLRKVLSRMFQMGFRITGLSLLTTVSYNFQGLRY